MEKNEGSCSILRSLNLDDIEDAVSEAYHQEGAGRPPRKPIGIFKALVVKRVKQIPSDRELYRRLWNDLDLREVCDIEEEQKPYHPTQLTRFRDRIGVERLDAGVLLFRSQIACLTNQQKAPQKEMRKSYGRTKRNYSNWKKYRR
jgi:transposase